MHQVLVGFPFQTMKAEATRLLHVAPPIFVLGWRLFNAAPALRFLFFFSFFFLLEFVCRAYSFVAF